MYLHNKKAPTKSNYLFMSLLVFILFALFCIGGSMDLAEAEAEQQFCLQQVEKGIWPNDTCN